MQVIPLKRECNSELVDELKRILAQAESGEIVGMIAVKLRPDNAFAVVRTGRCSDLELAGALSFAMHDLISQNNPKGE